MEFIFAKYGCTLETLHEPYVNSFCELENIRVYVPFTKNIDGWCEYFPTAQVTTQDIFTKYDLVIGKLSHMIKVCQGGLLIVHETIPPQALPLGLRQVIWTKTYTYLYKA